MLPSVARAYMALFDQSDVSVLAGSQAIGWWLTEERRDCLANSNTVPRCLGPRRRAHPTDPSL